MGFVSQKMEGAPKVYTGPSARGGMTFRWRNMSISNVLRLPPNE